MHLRICPRADHCTRRRFLIKNRLDEAIEWNALSNNEAEVSSCVLVTEVTTETEHVDNMAVIGWEDDGSLISDSDGNVV